MKENKNEEKNTYRIGVVPTNDGVIYKSSLWEVELTTNKLGVMACLVNFRDLMESFEELFFPGNYPEGVKPVENWVLNLVTVILAAIGLILLNPGLIAAAIVFRFLSLREMCTIAKMFFETKFGRKKAEGRFRKAAYTVLQAYDELGRIPEYEEIEKKKGYDKSEFNRMISISFLTIPFFIIISISQYVGMITYMILYALTIVWVLIVNKKRHIITNLQWLITNKPTEVEKKCALEGLKIAVQLCDAGKKARELMKDGRIVVGFDISDSNFLK